MIAYDTRAYRKQSHQRQQHQQPALLPIGDPAVLWRHTVCLNTIVHRLRYTLTVAVCVHVPRKSTTTAAVADFYGRDNDAVDPELDGPDHQEYDLQLLSRHVHVSNTITFSLAITTHIWSVFEFKSRFKTAKCADFQTHFFPSNDIFFFL